MLASERSGIMSPRAERLRLVAVHIDVELRRRGPPERLHESEGRVLHRALHECAHDLREALRTALAAILQIELEAARGAETEDRRRAEGEHQPFLDAGGLHEKIADQHLGVDLALVPGLLRDEDGGGVVAEVTAEEIEAGKGDHILVVRI